MSLRGSPRETAWRDAPLVVGHRGGRGPGWPPENTMPAFERARAEGARAIELDVRTCAGGDCVVFHDDTLARMTSNGRHDPRPVHAVRMDELRGIDLGGGARVPALAEVLAWARGAGVAVNVEMKHDVPRRAALALAAASAVRASGADVLFSSFDPLLLALAALRAPAAPRALLTYLGQPAWAGALQASIRPPLAGAVHIERTQADGRDLGRYAGRGVRLGAWTVNDAGEARDLARRGVASIITDRPGEILSALDGGGVTRR